MHDTFLTLLQDRAHWEFELFLMVLFDGIVAGILWPFVRLHWRHHILRDKHDQEIADACRIISPASNQKVGDTTMHDGISWTNAGPAPQRCSAAGYHCICGKYLYHTVACVQHNQKPWTPR